MKTIIRSSQSGQSEIRARFMKRFLPNAILTFNFFPDESKSNIISLVRLKPSRSFWEDEPSRETFLAVHQRKLVLLCPLLTTAAGTGEG